MPSFACPKCKKVLKTLNPLPAGKNIKCPACSQVFPAPAAATAQPTAVQANKPVAARKSAAGAPSVEAAKRTRPDLPANQQREREATRKAKARVDDDDEEEEERPKRKRKKKKAESQRSLVLILSGVGVLVLLIVVAAFIWPGFLKSSNTKTVTKAAPQARPVAPPDPLVFVPTPTDVVIGLDFSFIRNKPDELQQMENALRQQGVGEDRIDLLKSVDRGIFAAGDFANKPKIVLAFNTLTALDPEKVRGAFKAGPSDAVQGKTIYKMTDSKNPGDGFLSMPHEKTIVVGSMDQPEFLKTLDRQGQLLPEMQTQVSALRQKYAWAVINLQPIMSFRAKDVDALKSMPGGADVLPAIKNAKLAAFSIDWRNDAQLQLDIHCANDQEASQIESFAKSLWEKQGKPSLNSVPLLMGKQPGADSVKRLVEELGNGLRIVRDGAKVSATVTVSEATMKELDKIRPNAAAPNPPPNNAKTVNPKGRRRPNLNKKE